MYIKKKNLNPTRGEPREHRLGEAIQGRSKSEFNLCNIILLFDSSVFWGSGFNNLKLFRN